MCRTTLLAAIVTLGLLSTGDWGASAWAGPSESNPARCSDGVDNDGDGDIDCQDSGCDGLRDCEFGAELSCSDGVDNDGDGATDGADSDCIPACTPTESPEVSCSDGFDNDCDGSTDGADPDCAPACTPTESPEVSCSDGADNDCDGNIDGADPDCAPPCTPTESPEVSCSDGADNDCDGSTDGADSDCGGPGGGSTESCIPGFDYAMFSEGQTQWNGTPDADSWDSSSGTYAATSTCGSADVGTNSTVPGDFGVTGSARICGDAVIGPGGDPAAVITGGGTITGSREANSETIDLENVVVPVLSNGSPFSPSGNVGTLAPNRNYGTISCSGGPSSRVELQRGIYVIESLTLAGQCSVVVSDGPVLVYFTDSLSLQGGSVTNSTGIPSNLIFYGSSTATSVRMRGNSQAYFAVYAPQAACDIAGTADIFGATVCNTSSVSGTPGLHYDRALSEFEGGGFTCDVEEEGREVSRSNPIVADLDGTGEFQFQGSFEATSEAAPIFTGSADFEFPHVKGHLRAIDVASITASETGFGDNALTVLFDAADEIPAAIAAGCSVNFSAGCRTVFSNADTTGSPFIDKVFLETGAAERDALKPFLDPTSSWTDAQIELLISRILAGHDNGTTYEPALGGIDWSTMAIVTPSPLAGTSSRPAMIYVGGLDGMLHAFCAEAGVGACATAGQELWAYIPRTQLSLLQTNTARIDGSPTVQDVFGDADGDGRNEFRTVLTFQTGSGPGGSSPPAVYALDVTDPESPNIMWEVTTPGPGVDTAMGVTEGGDPATFLQSSTGAAGNAGSYVASIDTNTGAINWSLTYTYPAPRTGGNALVPNTAIPGGVTIVDKTGQNAISDVVVPGLYGEVFILDAQDGSNDYGANVPAVRFSNDYNPIGVAPTIYADQSTGTLHGLVVTGGYVDSTSATLWAPDEVTQFAVSFPLEIPITDAPIDENDDLIDFKIDFAAGERAFASAVVAGNELFIVTDSSNVNASDYGTVATGLLRRFNVNTGAAIGLASTVSGGAGAVAVSPATGIVYSGSGGAAQRVDLDSFDSAGTAVDLSTLAPLARRLFWLQL